MRGYTTNAEIHTAVGSSARSRRTACGVQHIARNPVKFSCATRIYGCRGAEVGGGSVRGAIRSAFRQMLRSGDHSYLQPIWRSALPSPHGVRRAAHKDAEMHTTVGISAPRRRTVCGVQHISRNPVKFSCATIIYGCRGAEVGSEPQEPVGGGVDGGGTYARSAVSGTALLRASFGAADCSRSTIWSAEPYGMVL